MTASLTYIENGNTITIDLGSVTSYSDSFSKSVTKFPVVTRSTRDAYAIEASSSMTISIDYARPCPEAPDDTGYDSTKWSNVKWVEEVDLAMDRWQADSDGFRFTMDSSDHPGMPSYTGKDVKNVYVKQFTYRFKAADVQFVYGSVSMTVGTMHCKCRRVRKRWRPCT